MRRGAEIVRDRRNNVSTIVRSSLRASSEPEQSIPLLEKEFLPRDEQRPIRKKRRAAFLDQLEYEISCVTGSAAPGGYFGLGTARIVVSIESPAMSTSPPLRKLNSHVSLLDSSRVQSPNPLHPSVILLFGWLEAEPAYLQKYVDRLHANFPTSTIVLIKADTSWYFSSESSLEKEVLPAVHTIRRELSDADRTRGVLVHVLSNGGALQLVTLRKALAKSGATEHPASRRSRLPIALVLDSTPASSELASAIQSWAPANTLMRWLAIPPITMLYTGFYIANALAGHPPVFRAIRDELKSADLLPTVTNRGEPEAIPRAYFTSNKDVITPMKDVETHYAEVVALGFDATIERFVGSAHVSHARLDPDRYWRAVNNVWKRALQKSGHGRVLASL